MKVVLSAMAVLLCFASIYPLTSGGEFEKGAVYSGFKLLEKRFVKEVNAECYYFEHIKSGARLFKIAADDQNKTFSIAFKTDPESDYGTPHIMEHSVLNGSKNFPVKSPFDVLQKGSLSTFMNAFTGNDLTCFPFASMNNKDYFNLMHVYLDAVFNPLLVTDSRILKQEGWHYEMEKNDAPIVYKGVVYNEMKGAFSNPTRELGYQIYKNLFPDNGYRFASGGYPNSIPNLTYKMFVDFHTKYYHPVNSHILLYGNADLNEELAFIDKEYLSKYDKSVRPESFPIQKPFTELKELTTYYPVAEDGKTENQTYLTLNFVAGLNTDRATTMALNILSDVLVNQEAAPIRLALQKAGIGQDVTASVDELRQNVFQIMVQNANPSDKDKFREIVFNTLRDVVKNGLDKKVIEGAINRTEFQLREGNDAQKGITYNFQVLPGWFFADDPYLTLEYEKPLSKVKTALEGNYFESVIRQYILDNKHALLLTMEPKPGLEKENSAAIEKKLNDYSASLSATEKSNLVNETQELIAYQKKEDTPEALNTMPLLSRKDINPKAEWYAVKENKLNGVPLLTHSEFCNNVVYSRMLFDLSSLPPELIPYASLLTAILGSQNTDNYSYGDLDNALNINTGGFNSFVTTYLVDQEDSKMNARFVVDSKAMNTKVDKMMSLLSEIINKTHYKDTTRLKEIIIRLQSRLENQVKVGGFQYAQTRLSSYYSNSGRFNEVTGGIEYYWFISDLAKNYDSKSKEITENLVKAASIIFNKTNLIAAVTSDDKDVPVFTKEMQIFINTLPDNKFSPTAWNFDLVKKNEGFLTTSKVQYVIKGFNIKRLGYKWNGKINVLSQILSTDWLQTRLRVLGGAYGGFSNFYQNGDVFFNSYRDPNLKETLVNYDAIPDYLDKLEINDVDMTRYIIGTISNLDAPMTSVQKGNKAIRYYMEKTKPEDIQKDRNDILATSLSDIKSMKQMMKDVVDQNNICVYGNEQKILSQKELFNKVEKLVK
ncbi:MAG: insulinase family protein [Bacteroidota bacterium]|nr:insulinase family protein [Bacteroidota bacterium]